MLTSAQKASINPDTRFMPATPSIAILLAAYNGRQWLAEQLGSIFSQQGVALQVFVSVDKSSDGTEEWLADFAQNESRITLLPMGERFGSAAKNFYRLIRDVDVSRFDYVAFADQDDIWRPEKLERAVGCLQQGFAGYSSDVLAFWPDGRQRLIKKAQAQRQWDFLFESPGPGCSFVVKRELIEQIQDGLNRHWTAIQQIDYHDWFVYAFARAHQLPWIIDDFAGVHYRQHTANELGANAGLRAFWARVQHVGDGEGFKQAAILAQMFGLENHPFISAWASGRRSGFCKLALAANQCRRRKRDRMYFFALCIKFCLQGYRSRV